MDPTSVKRRNANQQLLATVTMSPYHMSVDVWSFMDRRRGSRLSIFAEIVCFDNWRIAKAVQMLEAGTRTQRAFKQRWDTWRTILRHALQWGLSLTELDVAREWRRSPFHALKISLRCTTMQSGSPHVLVWPKNDEDNTSITPESVENDSLSFNASGINTRIYFLRGPPQKPFLDSILFISFLWSTFRASSSTLWRTQFASKYRFVIEFQLS